MNKRGQMQQVFFYIFAIIVTALILFLGIKGIYYVKTTGSEVEITNFITDIKSATQKNYNLGFGSVTSKELFTPSELTLVCFLDPEKRIDFSVISDPALKQKISLLSEQKDENVYINLQAKDNPLRSYKINNLKPKNDIQCIENPTDSIVLIFENKGKYAEVITQ